MKESKSLTKDPICGMTVDEATALHAEREERHSTFPATAVVKSFCPRPPVPKRRASLDDAVDKNTANEGVIFPDAGRVCVRVIRTDEEQMIARSVWRVERTALEGKAPPRAGLASEGDTA